MTAPNLGGQPSQGQPQQGWTPPGQQQFAPQQQQQHQPQQQQQAPQNQPFLPMQQSAQPEPHFQLPAPYFPQQQQQQQQNPQQQQQQRYQGDQIDPRQQQYNPAWMGGQPVQQGQPQQQYAPQQGQPQQQQRQAPAPAQNVQFDAYGRMFGPGLPQELQGKTMQEAVQLYGVMRQGYLQASGGQQQQRQPVQQQQQQIPARQQVAADARATSPWTDPEGFFGRLLDERLGPILQQSNEQQLASVRDDIARRYPIYQQYEQQVVQRLQGLPIETLRNPQAWELALSAVLGEERLRGGGQQQQQMQPGQSTMPWMNPGQIQVQQQNGQSSQLPWQQQQQIPPHQSFFTESPSAVMQGGMQPGDQYQVGMGQLSQAQLEVARRFGYTPQQYAAGLGIR